MNIIYNYFKTQLILMYKLSRVFTYNYKSALQNTLKYNNTLNQLRVIYIGVTWAHFLGGGNYKICVSFDVQNFFGVVAFPCPPPFDTYDYNYICSYI